MTCSKWRLDGKRALVAGSSRGIGRATAYEFLQLGAEVIVVARNKSEIDSTVNLWRKEGFKVHGFSADISEYSGRLLLFEFVTSIWDSMDVLVNNVGTNTRKPTVEYSELEIDALFKTNLMSAYGLCRLFFPKLCIAKNASIINISSIGGLTHMRSGSLYGMTKAAMNQMTRNLAVEWAKHGIRVNAVAPGFTRVEWMESLENRIDYVKEISDRTPAGRMAEPEEIAASIAFLSMPASSFTTGHCLVVDGGFLIDSF